MKNRKLIIIIAFLAALTIILGYLNMTNVDTTANEAGSITFISGESIIELSFNEITALEHHEFKATEDTSSSGPASRKYKGVLLKDVLNKASINNESIAASSKIIIKGLDGYVIAMSTDEVLSDKGVYLAFEKNGKPLGNMKNGGSGPFQLIAISDSFSQRWCKYVFEVSLE
jgi:DMSO/TMAO reductase YedYZ molybdopterin-dependent catalytic subunit